MGARGEQIVSYRTACGCGAPVDEGLVRIPFHDALLLTSRAEGGGPRVVPEALACGLPVVATPVGEDRRTVEHMVDARLGDVLGHDLESLWFGSSVPVA